MLIVDSPFIFRPVWLAIKPALGKYSSLVRFVSAEEGKEYFADDVDVGF